MEILHRCYGTTELFNGSSIHDNSCRFFLALLCQKLSGSKVIPPPSFGSQKWPSHTAPESHKCFSSGKLEYAWWTMTKTYKLLFKMHNYNKIYKLNTVSIMSLLLVRPAFHLVHLTGNIVILPSSRHFIRSYLIDSWLITPLRNFAKIFIVYKSGGKCNCEEPTILKFQIASGRPCASMWCCALLLVEQQSAFSHRRMDTLG